MRPHNKQGWSQDLNPGSLTLILLLTWNWPYFALICTFDYLFAYHFRRWIFYMHIVLWLLSWLNWYLMGTDMNRRVGNGLIKKGGWAAAKNVMRMKLSRRLTLHIFPNIHFFLNPLTKPRSSQRERVHW